MNSIIVSETCTAPRVPIHAPHTPNSTCPPLAKLGSLVPAVFHPTTTPAPPPLLSLTDSSNFQSLAGRPTLNLCTLLLYSPGSRPVGFSVLFQACRRMKGGGQEGRRRSVEAAASIFLGLCARCGAAQCEAVGVEFGHGSFSPLRNTMGP